METLGDILADACGWKRKRGHAFWVENSVWQLGLYQKARKKFHPGLITEPKPELAPGTSQQSGKRSYKRAFVLHHPEVLNGKPSTFFLALAKYIRVDDLGGHLGQIHENDLRRLNKVLGHDGDRHEEAD